MKALNNFRTYINKHFWADFLFTFIVYGALSLILKSIFYVGGESLSQFILNVFLFSLIMTPVFRLIRKMKIDPHPMDLGDHATYYKAGQRSKLKKYSESNGFAVNRNEGATTYFDPPSTQVKFTGGTFIYETDHWMALIASPDIQNNVPIDINRLYPLTSK